MDTLKTWVQSRWLTPCIGLLMIAALIWLGGPYLGIGERQPLASPAARLALILAMVLLCLLAMQILQWRAQRKTARLSGDLAGQEARIAAEEPGSAERVPKRARLAEAPGERELLLGELACPVLFTQCVMGERSVGGPGELAAGADCKPRESFGAGGEILQAGSLLALGDP